MSAPHVTEWGDGDRLALLVHGLSSSGRTWARTGPELAARGYRVLAPDLGGHGRSPRSDVYSRERWAAELIDLVGPGRRPELVLGHSLGGVLLAMAVEELRPRRAVYLDPAWYPWSRDAAFGASQDRFRALPGTPAADLAAANPRWDAAAVADRHAEIAEWDPATSRMRFLETAAVPVFPLVPSLVVVAGASPVLAPPLVEHLAGVGFTVRRVEMAGHFVHLDDPDGFRDAVDDRL